MAKIIPLDELVNIATTFMKEIDFKRDNPKAYNQAKKLGVLEELCEHMESLDEYYKRSKRKRLEDTEE